ncbi:HNHc domain containing protein [uncultured Caudovirales phage]|uniref:HNHc domain containing protein n=1 Tax=uncultured Caudovirales phage TaxID=2100421 RepID=A0A6J7XIX9_9CAUD|nr:HNHc domain containing protein [uncultured Caudovirales phage]
MPHVDAAVRKAYMKAYGARYYAKNADKWILYAARFCAANPKKRKAYSARYYAKNAEKVNARRARYDAEHPEKARARKARYHAKHPEGDQAYQARYRAENREKVKASEARSRAKHPEKRKASYARYYAKNPEKMKANNAKRRACKRSAGGRGITGHQWRDVLTSTLGLCTYCNELRPLALDHIVPLSAGGDHDIENAVPACKSCNSAKNKTPLLLWLARRAA